MCVCVWEGGLPYSAVGREGDVRQRLGGYRGGYEMGTKLGEGWRSGRSKASKVSSCQDLREQSEATIQNRNVRWRLIQKETA